MVTFIVLVISSTQQQSQQQPNELYANVIAIFNSTPAAGILTRPGDQWKPDSRAELWLITMIMHLAADYYCFHPDMLLFLPLFLPLRINPPCGCDPPVAFDCGIDMKIIARFIHHLLVSSLN